MSSALICWMTTNSPPKNSTSKQSSHSNNIYMTEHRLLNLQLARAHQQGELARQEAGQYQRQLEPADGPARGPVSKALEWRRQVGSEKELNARLRAHLRPEEQMSSSVRGGLSEDREASDQVIRNLLEEFGEERQSCIQWKAAALRSENESASSKATIQKLPSTPG